MASNRDRFSRMDISLGLRWLKNRGWAEKDGGLASRARPDLGNAWRLTPDGQGEVDRLLAKRVAWEKAQAEVDH